MFRHLSSYIRPGKRPLRSRNSFFVGAAMKPLAMITSGLLILLSQPGFTKSSPIEQYSQKTLLKNWALSRCLSQAYMDENVRADANASASAYLEFGSQPIEVYAELDKLIEKYLHATYKGSITSDFNTMKCIDLFHSAELEFVTDKASRLNKSGT